MKIIITRAVIGPTGPLVEGDEFVVTSREQELFAEDLLKRQRAKLPEDVVASVDGKPAEKRVR